MPPKKPIIDDNGINFGQLNKVIQGQLDADAKYDRENDAKFRAVRQKVATYEEFENIVLGAHLKPLKENITELELKKTGWLSGRAAERTRASDHIDHTDDGNGAQPRNAKPPQTCQEFTREWRRLRKIGDATEQYKFLLLTGASIATLFKTGVDNVLGEFVTAMGNGFDAGDATRVVRVLRALAATPRFSLAKEFLDEKEQAAITELLTKLVEAVESGGDETPPQEKPKGTESAESFDPVSNGDVAEAAPDRATLEDVSELRGLYAM
eukprot:m.572658 g.572658  ORF g.572658 m.572658 type:complete len:267 (+) comp22273_c1_seq4:125-925(+)